jgi:hypothetical protein
MCSEGQYWLLNMRVTDRNSSCLIVLKTARLMEEMYEYYRGTRDSFVPTRLRDSYLAPKNYLYTQKSM